MSSISYFRPYRNGIVYYGVGSSLASWEFTKLLREFEECIPEGTHLRERTEHYDGLRFTITEAVGPLEGWLYADHWDGLEQAMRKISRNVREKQLMGAALYNGSTWVARKDALQMALFRLGTDMFEGEVYEAFKEAFGPILTEGFRGAALAYDGAIPNAREISDCAKKVRLRRYPEIPEENI